VPPRSPHALTAEQIAQVVHQLVERNTDCDLPPLTTADMDAARQIERLSHGNWTRLAECWEMGWADRFYRQHITSLPGFAKQFIKLAALAADHEDTRCDSCGTQCLSHELLPDDGGCPACAATEFSFPQISAFEQRLEDRQTWRDAAALTVDQRQAA
jgi:hypothetical protein